MFDVDVPLGVGDFDAVFLETAPDLLVDFGAEGVGFGLEGLAPETEFEVEGGVTKLQKADGGSGGFQGIRTIFRRFEKGFFDQINIAFVVDPDRNAEADPIVVVAEVGDAVVDELGIGNDDVDIVIGPDSGAAGADFHHHALEIIDFDPVPDFDWALGEEDQAGNKVVGDIAQTKTNPERERTGHHRKGAEIEAGQGDGQNGEQADEQNRVTNQGRGGEAGAMPQADAGKNPPGQDSFDQAAGNPNQGEEEYPGQDGGNGERKTPHVVGSVPKSVPPGVIRWVDGG